MAACVSCSPTASERETQAAMDYGLRTDRCMQILGIIWFLGICIGHTALLTLSINWWYSFALPSRLLSCMRLGHAGLVLLGLVAFTRAYFFPSSSLYPLSSIPYFGEFAQSVAGAYALVCGLIGLGYVPL